MKVPPFLRRLFKFTSMDFETAVWEMTHLIIAPKKVFRNIYYHVSFFFVLVHFLGTSLLVSTLMYFLVGRVLGRKRQGLFGPPIGGQGSAGTGGAQGEELEFGYCFDVSIRAFLPIWAFLYVLQFLLLPLIVQDYWVSNLFGNTMYLLALSYYFVITFLGYNGKFSMASAC
ncbi:hypothetical protein LTR86_006492 [Recurvomyces mirabilis]|nr:hypothetical protein LTR86_006492 [Recurvomyces mirabilis]